jgi:hypothetical protein
LSARGLQAGLTVRVVRNVVMVRACWQSRAKDQASSGVQFFSYASGVKSWQFTAFDASLSLAGAICVTSLKNMRHKNKY